MLAQIAAMFLMMAVIVAVQAVVIWTYCALVITRDRTVLDARRIALNPAVAAAASCCLLLSAVPALSLPILLLAPLEPAIKAVLLIGSMRPAGTTAATLCQVFGKGDCRYAAGLAAMTALLSMTPCRPLCWRGCSSFDVAVWVEYGSARVKAPVNESLNPEAHAWIT